MWVDAFAFFVQHVPVGLRGSPCLILSENGPLFPENGPLLRWIRLIPVPIEAPDSEPPTEELTLSCWEMFNKPKDGPRKILRRDVLE